MKKIFFTVLIFFILIAGCKKNTTINPATLPTASFSVIGDTLNNIITIGTYSQYMIVNNSTNASSYSWDFGNDSTSSLESPILSYPKSGTYTLRLTVQNKGGQKSVKTKIVKVLDRVLRQIAITGLTPINTSFNQSLDLSNIWVEIKLGANDSSYTLPTDPISSSFNSPIIYQSPIISDFDSTKVPYILNVTNKIVLDLPNLMLWNFKGVGVKGIGYGLELYAQNSGKTFLVSSSYAGLYLSGAYGVGITKDDIQNNIFLAGFGDIQLICDYE